VYTEHKQQTQRDVSSTVYTEHKQRIQQFSSPGPATFLC
jgi:hypothetical protein